MLERLRSWFGRVADAEDERALTLVSRRRFLAGALAAVPAVMAPKALLDALDSPLISLPARPIKWFPGYYMGSLANALEPIQYEYNSALSEIVRRAFVPKMIVQIYDSSPVMAALLRQGDQNGGYRQSHRVGVLAAWEDRPRR